MFNDKNLRQEYIDYAKRAEIGFRADYSEYIDELSKVNDNELDKTFLSFLYTIKSDSAKPTGAYRSKAEIGRVLSGMIAEHKNYEYYVVLVNTEVNKFSNKQKTLDFVSECQEKKLKNVKLGLADREGMQLCNFVKAY